MPTFQLRLREPPRPETEENDTMEPPSAHLGSPPAAEDEGSPSEHVESLSQSISQGFSPGLSKSNSTASRFSLRSHVSMRTIGTIPLGELRLLHGRSESDTTTEKDMISSIITEEDTPDSPWSCLAKGDIFRLLGMPCEFIVGHDSTAMTTSESFPGFRDIPPGAHFLWVQKPTPSPRCGYWYLTEQKPVVRVKQWDRYNEVLGDAASQYEVRNQEANIGPVYATLQPYSLTGASDPTAASGTGRRALELGEPGFMTDPAAMWRQLTDAITRRFLDRVTSKRSVNEWLVDTMDGSKGDSQTLLPNHPTTTSTAYRTIVGSEFRFHFTQDFQDLRILDSRSHQYPPNPSTNPDDTTPRVLSLIANTDGSDIVAELQFTFITGTHLGNPACLSQWWDLVLKIVLRAVRLAVDSPVLCERLLRTLHAQLVYTEGHVEGGGGGEEDKSDGPSGDRLLFHAVGRGKALLREGLAGYKRRLNRVLLDLGGGITSEQENVGRVWEEMEAWLWRRGWDLRAEREDGRELKEILKGRGGRDGEGGGDEDGDEEDDDDLPVIVDLDEDGREVGLVSFHRD